MTKPFTEKEMDKEMDKFMKKLDVEGVQKDGKRIVFVETDTQLESALNFSQYIFHNKRLITLIGERHDLTFGCPAPAISLANYCKHAVERNPQCYILLEYNRSDDPTRIGSHAIRSVYAALDSAGKKDRIVPYDFRPYFLTRRGQNELYDTDMTQYSDQKELGMKFIEPFFKLQRDEDIFKLKGKFDERVLEYLLKKYYPDMDHSFRTAAKALGGPLDNLRQILKDAWMKVADYYVLENVLRDDDVDEYIIITGESHRINIQQTLHAPYITEIVKSKAGSPGNCVKLFKTYRFN